MKLRMSAILGKESGGERIDRGAVCGIGGLRVNSACPLRSLRLCGERNPLTDPQRAHNMRTLLKCIIGVVLVHTYRLHLRVFGLPSLSTRKFALPWMMFRLALTGESNYGHTAASS
jgi:hypothetical protein